MAQVFKGTRDKKQGRKENATADQISAREDLAQARSQTRARKLDTRRKILLGGGLLALARAGDETATALVHKIINHQFRDIDQKAFEGWSVTSGE
ncbi:hypothetical protein TRP8649_04753 [Pelagimonas phthalicica]|uniref:Mobilization protein n=1 Tax=Pelagimonas phthalicica TaxID=1037362 RepID=A0A238JIW5_9RHOB|nr:mobilization protein [Pelagimonas phthalicica]TDS87036.1 relaxasome subunit MobC [Pelagimonas phthalicica]SMX30609.1 hypothetical protein TRP8649_04753 [Pelagimonas phthalicica]